MYIYKYCRTIVNELWKNFDFSRNGLRPDGNTAVHVFCALEDPISILLMFCLHARTYSTCMQKKVTSGQMSFFISRSGTLYRCFFFSNAKR